MSTVTALNILALTSLGILFFCVSQDWIWMSAIYAWLTLLITREMHRVAAKDRKRAAAQPEEKAHSDYPYNHPDCCEPVRPEEDQ